LDVYARKLTWDEGCYKTAEFFKSRGSFRQALTVYEALLEDHPTNFYAHYMLGNLLVRRGEVASGISHYEQSIRSNPRYPNARLDLGLLEINEGMFDEALGDLNAALGAAGNETPPALRANIYYGLA